MATPEPPPALSGDEQPPPAPGPGRPMKQQSHLGQGERLPRLDIPVFYDSGLVTKTRIRIKN